MASRKGMVLESGKDWAIILLPNGEYKKIKTSRFLEVGELYQYGERSPFRYAAAAVIFLAVIFTTLDYFTVQAYAQFESLQLGVNRWGRVISVHPTDIDGEHNLNVVNKNEKLESVVEKIYTQKLENEQVEAAPKEDQKPVLSVATKNDNEKLEQIMLEKIDSGLQKAKQTNKQNRIENITKPAEPGQEKDPVNSKRAPGNQTNNKQ